jgi:hypothetical protein
VAEATSDSFYDALMDSLAASGSPAFAILADRDQVVNILAAAERHPVVSSSEYVWIASDDWIGTKDVIPPAGTFGLAPLPLNRTAPISGEFIALWKTLDPVEFPDADGDRNSLYLYSSYTFESVIALAEAYQSVLDSNFQGQPSEFRRTAFSALLNDVTFNSLTGFVDIDAQGNRLYASYEVYNFNGTAWITVGYSQSSRGSSRSYETTVALSKFLWPDGTIGATNKYSTQYVPTCPAGSEPVQESERYICSLCEVGYYKPYTGMSKCKTCPEGAACDDVGISIPCVQPKYWRVVPPPGKEGDFNKYGIYRCDIDSRCNGGCILNATCNSEVKQDSPVCGVCSEGYYDNSDSCLKCPHDETFLRAMELLLGIGASLIGCALLFSLYLSSVCSKTGLPMRAFFDPSFDPSSAVTTNRPESASIISSMRQSIFNKLFFYAKAAKGQGLFVTVKLTVSFAQVLVGSVANLNVDWTGNIDNLLKSLKFNPLQAVPLFSGCDGGSYNKTYVEIMLVLFVPLIMVALASLLHRFITALARRNRNLNAAVISHVSKSLSDITLKSLVWFCLFSFPILARS